MRFTVAARPYNSEKGARTRLRQIWSGGGCVHCALHRGTARVESAECSEGTPILNPTPSLPHNKLLCTYTGQSNWNELSNVTILHPTVRMVLGNTSSDFLELVLIPPYMHDKGLHAAQLIIH